MAGLYQIHFEKDGKTGFAQKSKDDPIPTHDELVALAKEILHREDIGGCNVIAYEEGESGFLYTTNEQCN